MATNIKCKNLEDYWEQTRGCPILKISKIIENKHVAVLFLKIDWKIPTIIVCDLCIQCRNSINFLRFIALNHVILRPFLTVFIALACYIKLQWKHKLYSNHTHIKQPTNISTFKLQPTTIYTVYLLQHFDVTNSTGSLDLTLVLNIFWYQGQMFVFSIISTNWDDTETPCHGQQGPVYPV